MYLTSSTEGELVGAIAIYCCVPVGDAVALAT